MRVGIGCDDATLGLGLGHASRVFRSARARGPTLTSLRRREFYFRTPAPNGQHRPSTIWSFSQRPLLAALRQPFQLACLKRARARDVRIAPMVAVEGGCAASPNRTYGRLSLLQGKLQRLGAPYAAAREARAKEARRIQQAELAGFAHRLGRRRNRVCLRGRSRNSTPDHFP